MVGFNGADERAADTLLAALWVVTAATSFGGVHSTAERRARWGGEDVHPGFIRPSIGLGDPGDLLADLTRTMSP